VRAIDALDLPESRILACTNTGPAGAGKRFGGYEEWQIGVAALTSVSRVHYDVAEYECQLELGFGE
jgi:hypothetical protein